MTTYSFETSVRKYFDFLKIEFGFINNQKNIGYEKNGLEIEFYHGNGELDIIFFVRKNDEIFKPFVSRTFYLFNIVRKLKGRKITGTENMPQYITSSQNIEEFLLFCAELMKTYCSKQLEGDLSIFEEIHIARRENA